MIKYIHIAAASGVPQESVEVAQLVAGAGIVGDRNYGLADYPGQQITFIEMEEIDSFNRRFGQQQPPWAARRNVVTEGVRLNQLVGRDFAVGAVTFRGIELCEPCAYLGELLETPELARQEVVRAFLHRGGLRADILTDGDIHVGMPLRSLPPAS